MIAINISCADNKTSKSVITPSNIALEKYFRNYKNVILQEESGFLQRKFPIPDPGQLFFELDISINDSLQINNIACLLVTLERIIERNEIEKTEESFEDRRPIFSIKKEILFREYYNPTSQSFLINVANRYSEYGEYELTYGIFLKSDTINEEISYYAIKCGYLIEQ